MNCEWVKTSWLCNEGSGHALNSQIAPNTNTVIITIGESLKQWKPNIKGAKVIGNILDKEKPNISLRQIELCDTTIFVVACLCSINLQDLFSIQDKLSQQGAGATLLLSTKTPIEKVRLSAEYTAAKIFNFCITYSSTISLAQDMQSEQHCSLCSPLLSIEKDIDYLMNNSGEIS